MPGGFTAVIMAGGASTRMGRDKAWIECGGRPLIARQVELARLAGAEQVVIAGRAGAEYPGIPGEVVFDREAGRGPMAGVVRGLEAARLPLVLVLAVDLGAMTVDTLHALRARCGDSRGIIPRVCGGLEPLAAFYPRGVLALAGEALAARRLAMRAFAERCIAQGFAECLDVPAEMRGCFANWNTPADVPHTEGGPDSR